jgi:hypothetical protein
MKKLKMPLVAAIAIGLLAGSAVGVAAQEPETEAPTEFTATWAHNFGPPGVRPNVPEGFDPVRGRGYANHPRIIETSGDPRFEGEVTLVVNHDTYLSDGALRVFHRAFSVENDEGTWRGVPYPTLQFSDASGSGVATQLFIGEEAYAGSYALAEIQSDPAAEVWTLRGVIFEGEPPPAPEPFVSE